MTMTRRAGFTLIELVVVIMILGILAGVAAPKLFNTSANANDNGAKQSLAIVRDAIELYAANNGGALPPAATFPAEILPYIRGTFPICPVGDNAGSSDVASGGLSIATGDGWAYDQGTGVFIINSDDVCKVDGVTPYNNF